MRLTAVNTCLQASRGRHMQLPSHIADTEAGISVRSAKKRDSYKTFLRLLPHLDAIIRHYIGHAIHGRTQDGFHGVSSGKFRDVASFRKVRRLRCGSVISRCVTPVSAVRAGLRCAGAMCSVSLCVVTGGAQHSPPREMVVASVMVAIVDPWW